MPRFTARLRSIAAAGCACLVISTFAQVLARAPNPSLLLSTPLTRGAAVKTAVDSQGNVYVAGTVANPPAIFGCVVKLTPARVIVYTKCFQGSQFSQVQSWSCGLHIADLAVDKNGFAYIVGCTTGRDFFPLVNSFRATPQFRDNVFVAKLSPAGDIVYSTLFGAGEFDQGTAIAADEAGHAYFGGWTTGPNLPLVNAVATSGRGFIAKFDPTGSRLLYSTYIPEIPRAVAVDRAGAAYAALRSTGAVTTVRPVQPCTDRGADALVLKLNPAGSSYDYLTCLGGSNGDEATDIAVDAAGSAYVVGTTGSLDFPLVHPIDWPRRMGSVWKTPDAGRTWTSLPVVAGASRIVAPPTRPGTYYLTGIDSDGLLMSTDSGRTWRRRAAPPSNFGRQPTVLTLAIDPRAPTTLYLSTDVALYKSIDDGEHWSELVRGVPFRGAYLRGIAVDPADSRVVFAADLSGVWKSVDGGMTWSASSIGVTGRHFVEAFTGDPVTGVLYADVHWPAGFFGSLDRIYRSTDRGATWTPTPVEFRDRSITLLTAVGGGAAGTVFVAARRTTFPGPAALVFRSDDDGATWGSIGDGLPENGIEALAAAPSDPRIVYAGAGETLFVSSDRGHTFAPVPRKSWPQGVRGLAIDPFDRSSVFVLTGSNSDSFVAKIAPTGGTLEYATYLGASAEDHATGVAIDDFGRAIVFGSTSSEDFPAVAPLQARRGGSDAFISVLDGGGSVLLFSSQFGGTGADSITATIPLGRQILFSGGSSDLASTFPGSGARGAGAFLGLLDLSSGAPVGRER